jgi:AcrR family transcriptional regulator
MANDPTPYDEPATASDGRVPGRRGRRTRETLLDSTARLLASTSYRDLTVVQIAREAKTSSATFYQYFSDVEDAVVVLANRLVGDAQRLVAPIEEGDWGPGNAEGAALELADAFLGFWRDHEALMRVVNLGIVEGDRRFRKIRNEILGPVTTRLGKQISERRGEDDHATADAAALVSMLVHVAEQRPGVRDWQVSLPDLRASMARIVASSMGG